MKKFNKKVGNQIGLTLIELLIALVLSGIITIAAFKFYINEHNNLLVQQSVSDMQQNIRASIDAITLEVRNAGSNLPLGLQSLESSDALTDSLIVRYALMGGSANVGEFTPPDQASPIHIDKNADLSQFAIGDRVLLWHSGTKQGEWFDITNMTVNLGTGWNEIHHQGQNFVSSPQIGDKMIKMNEVSYFIDTSDPTHPMLMRSVNGLTPQIFADNISDLQVQYVLSNATTVSTVTPNDTVYVVNLSLAAHTDDVDVKLADRSQDGYRRRSLSTDILVRNNRFQ